MKFGEKASHFQRDPKHMPSSLVNLHLCVYLSDEWEWCEETYGPRQNPEGEDNDESVSKVQNCWYHSCDAQLKKLINAPHVKNL